jgi:formylglycine-generating enzyme required for sulfatase activity
VGKKKPNAFGLYDMLGNVMEWTGDWLGTYPAGEVTDPTGADTGPYRVNRGGGWSGNARDVRAADRSACYPADRHDILGFRVSRSL